MIHAVLLFRSIRSN